MKTEDKIAYAVLGGCLLVVPLLLHYSLKPRQAATDPADSAESLAAPPLAQQSEPAKPASTTETAQPQASPPLPERLPLPEPVEVESNGEIYTFQVIDSFTWGSGDARHTFYSVNTDRQNEDAMKEFTDSLPITRSVRVFFFTRWAPLLNFSDGEHLAALSYIEKHDPIATTFKLDLGNRMVLYDKGFKGLY